MRRHLFLISSISFFAFLPSFSFSQELSPQEIVKRSDDLMAGDTQEGTYTMSITTPSWERTLKLYVVSVGRDKMFIRILSPAKEKGITKVVYDRAGYLYHGRVKEGADGAREGGLQF